MRILTLCFFLSFNFIVFLLFVAIAYVSDKETLWYISIVELHVYIEVENREDHLFST
jgi:hypothetical protein